MHTLRIRERGLERKSLVSAKTKFLTELEGALTKEKTIAQYISRVERVAKPTARAGTSNIALRFGLMDNFVRHVYEKHTHDMNAAKIQALIDNTKRELANLQKSAQVQRVITKKTLSIHFRHGVIKPTGNVSDRALDRYRWELQSDAQTWTQIGETGAREIRPEITSGEVRLTYSQGNYGVLLQSNKIKLSTVIKRQAASAKRKQYRFSAGDIQFEQRCKGVAGRIRRMMKPPRHICEADFDSRVFQDRVSRLPDHLNVDAIDVLDLCETGTTADPEFIRMIEFVEPTVHLNPKKLHAELKDIYQGNRISLVLPEAKVPKAPKKPELFMFTDDVNEQKEQEDADLAEAQRQGAIERERRQQARQQAELDRLEQQQRERRQAEDAARLDEERLRAEAEALAKAERLRKEAEEQTARAAAEAERLRKEAEEQTARAAAEAERIRKEAEEQTARAAAEAERLRKEAEEQAVQAAARQERIAQETRVAEKRAAETAERLAREREVQQQRTSDSVMRVFQTKSAGENYYRAQEDGSNVWFMVVNKSVYKMRPTGNSAEKKSLSGANASGWRADPDAMKLAEEERDNRRELARKKKQLEREAKEQADKELADKALLDAERLRKESEAAAEAESLRKEAEAQAAQAAAEAESLRKEAEEQAARAAAEDERLRKEAEEQAARAAAEDERLRKEAEAQAAEAARTAKIATLRSNAEQLAFVKYVFETFDVNEDGELQELEILKAYFNGKTRIRTGGAQRVIVQNDQDDNGTLSIDEFIDWCAVSGALETAQWKAAAAEFKAALVSTAEVASVSAAGEKRVMQNFDTIAMGVSALASEARLTDGNAWFTVGEKVYKVRSTGNSAEKKTLSAADAAGWVRAPASAAAAPRQPPGELSQMVENMTDWVSSDEELNFAEESEAESMEFAASSSIDTDSDLDFAQSSERSLGANSSGEESSERVKTSSGMEFAESSSAETDSDVEFAESSDKTSSGLEFADSSAVDESD